MWANRQTEVMWADRRFPGGRPERGAGLCRHRTEAIQRPFSFRSDPGVLVRKQGGDRGNCRHRPGPVQTEGSGRVASGKGIVVGELVNKFPNQRVWLRGHGHVGVMELSGSNRASRSRQRALLTTGY
jgi:hypothetical protein